MSDLPFYIDDPLVDRDAYRLGMHADEVESARRGYTAMFGTCSCGEWATPTWDSSAVLEAYDSHMTDVQAAIHAALASQRGSMASEPDSRAALNRRLRGRRRARPVPGWRGGLAWTSRSRTRRRGPTPGCSR